MMDSIELSDKWIEYLKSEGETGMGYHIVMVSMSDGRVLEKTILNSSILLDGNDINTDEIIGMEVL